MPPDPESTLSTSTELYFLSGLPHKLTLDPDSEAHSN